MSAYTTTLGRTAGRRNVPFECFVKRFAGRILLLVFFCLQTLHATMIIVIIVKTHVVADEAKVVC